MKYALVALCTFVFGFLVGYPWTGSSGRSEKGDAPALSEKEVCGDLISRYNKLSDQYVSLQKDYQSNSTGMTGANAMNATGAATPALSPECPSATPVANADDTPKDAKPDEAAKIAMDSPDSERSDVPTEKDKISPVDLNQLKKQISLFDSESQKAGTGSKRRSFLNRIVLADPHGTIDLMQSVGEKDKWLEKMMGVYRGGIQFTKKNRPPGYVRLEIRTPDNPPWQWSVKVDVHEKKGEVERKTGGLETLHTVSDQSRGYFVRSSENSYLQFFFQNEESLLGNYYERGSDGIYNRVGTYTLKRSED